MPTPEYTPNDGPTALVPAGDALLALAGQAANQHAAQNAVGDYLSRKAANTIRRQAADLQRLADFLDAIGDGIGARMARFATAVRQFPDQQPDPAAWQGVTWGLVEGFRNWMVGQGDAVGSVNVRLSTVKAYCKLAVKADALDAQDYAMIRLVAGYAHKEGKRIDERRETTRRGLKKAQHVPISDKQARALKRQPDTPQGRRDAVLMCLLLDHGLRCGEVALLKVSDFDLKAGELRFYRPKVDLEQTHKLTADTLRTLRAWFDSGDAPAAGPLLRGSRKSKAGDKLTGAGLTERAITARVRDLGQRIGLDGLSAHDCRHYWATHWAGKVDPFRLQEAGGWASLAMPRRYVQAAEIANEGMA